MLPANYNLTVIYATDDNNPAPLIIDERFRNLTITTQPLTLNEVVTPELTIEDLNKNPSKYIQPFTAVAADNMQGTVTLKAVPPNTHHQYDLPDNVIDLANPHFLTTQVPIKELYPSFDGVSGSDVIAVSVVGFIN